MSPPLGAAGPLSVHLAAREAPEHPAVVQGELRLSYAELAARVAGAQLELRAKSPEGLRGRRVATVARPDLASVVWVSALLEEGAVPCMLHPRLPDPLKAELAARTGAVSAASVGVGPELPEPAKAPPPLVERDPEADLAIFFTSGSTASPKGVRLSRRAFVASAEGSARNLGWQADDRWLVNLPIAHIGGFSIFTRTRLARATMVLEAEPGGFDPHRLLHTLEGSQVSLLSLVPTMLHRVVQAGLRAPASLRVLLLGGAPASPELLAEGARLGWPILGTYGLTESCSQVTVQPYGEAPGPEQGAGLPLAGVELKADADGIAVRGPTLMSGYLPEDAGAFDAAGWFRTGDLGRLDARGRLFVLGRAKEMILSGGENVSPLRVEASLRALPGVRDVVVYGLPDPEWGEVVGATVVLEEGATIEGVGVQARALLAGFERPRHLVAAETLPLLPSGKIDRRSARAAAERARAAEKRAGKGASADDLD